jgi:hypothetical protein
MMRWPVCLSKGYRKVPKNLYLFDVGARPESVAIGRRPGEVHQVAVFASDNHLQY